MCPNPIDQEQYESGRRWWRHDSDGHLNSQRAPVTGIAELLSGFLVRIPRYKLTHFEVHCPQQIGSVFNFFFFLASPHSVQGLSSPPSAWACTPCNGSTDSSLLDHRGNPPTNTFLNTMGRTQFIHSVEPSDREYMPCGMILDKIQLIQIAKSGKPGLSFGNMHELGLVN